MIKSHMTRVLRLKKTLLAIFLALMPIFGFAAGLGAIKVTSSLGEPFRAEIQLLLVNAEDLANLSASFASKEAYDAQGITYQHIDSNIKVEVGASANGAPVLKLSSIQPINDTFLDMLIQVDWASGRVQHEYNVLLDSPKAKSANDETQALPIAMPKNPSESDTVDAKSINASNQSITEDEKSQINKDAKFITTKQGDTLSNIAKLEQLEGVSIDQMLVGLFDNNKQAFMNSNMNRLKIGEIIRVPVRDKLVLIDAYKATQLVKLHSANWSSYSALLAGHALSTAVPSEIDQKQSVSGKIANIADQAPSAKVILKDVVKLSAGDRDIADASKAMEAKITMLQEENAAHAKSLKEAQQRTAILERQIADMQKLLALKSQVMSDLQKNAVVAENRHNPNTITLEDAWLRLFNNVIIITILITSILGALFLYAWTLLRRKLKKEAAFDQIQLNAPGSNYVSDNKSPIKSSSLPEVLQRFDDDLEDRYDIDPIAESDIYMTYGHHLQAINVLEMAILKDPKRYELYLKLLEIYAHDKNDEAFESIAKKLSVMLDYDDPLLVKVSELAATLKANDGLIQPDGVVMRAKDTGKASTINPSIADISQLPSSDLLLDKPNNPDISMQKIDGVSLDLNIESDNKISDQPEAHQEQVNNQEGSKLNVKDSLIGKNANGFDFSSISFNLDDEQDSKPARLKTTKKVSPDLKSKKK